MLDALRDGRLQVTAAASLLENSRLVEWIPKTKLFVPVPRDIFEYSIRRDVDPVFGRLICWILFSAGAEFLVKGLCLVEGIKICTEKEVPEYPSNELKAWIPNYRKNWKHNGIVKVPNFGTIAGFLQNKKGGDPSHLKMLCDKKNASPEEEDLLFAGYDFLARRIRNRDAHAYIPNVRDSHYSLVPDLFCNCFNLLVSWLPDGGETLNSWRGEAQAENL
ncbi:MAG TPA: hypothetical protein VG759_02150 [Candidatus Angelobacter sp.]|jgi:hypothetical protein|nr:hypothetical protein [Candidatus Angelobacter sp.]